MKIIRILFILSLSLAINATITIKSSNKEIELKIRITEEQLQKLKNWLDKWATYQGEETHTEYYLENNSYSNLFSFSRESQPPKTLRVRLSSKNDLVILKVFHSDPTNIRKFNRDQWEVEIDDGKKMLEIFEKIGYSKKTVIKKRRKIYLTIFKKTIFEITLDKVVKLGNFVEIEIKDKKNEIKNHRKGYEKILNLLLEIGIESCIIYDEGYIAMIKNPKKKFGREIKLHENY